MAKRWTRRFAAWLVPLAVPCVAWTLRALGRTWRVEVDGADPLASPGAVIGATWHRNILIGAAVYRDQGHTVPISRSRDGDLISAVVVRLGWTPPPRGSSSRGAAAVLRETIRRIEEGVSVAVLCDGPRGPARRSKIGAVSAAAATGCRLVPVAFAAHPCSRFRSWDGTLLPWPFARVVVHYGDAVDVPRDHADGAHDRANTALEERLNALTDALDTRLGVAPD